MCATVLTAECLTFRVSIACRNAPVLERCETEGDTAENVQRIFCDLAASARHPKWKGCGFLRTSVELIHLPGHPAIIAVRAHKKRVEDWLYSVFADMRSAGDARLFACQIILLLDGAFAVVLLH